MNQPEEIQLFEQVQKSNQKAFEILFHRYYSNLCLYATKIIHDDIAAEEIVQGFFVKFWEKREELKVNTSIQNYFVRSIKNLCINYIKHNKIKLEYAHQNLSEKESQFMTEHNFFEIDLAEKIEESINSLPEKRREIFRLSRENGLKYREIAEKLNISIKTVEAQMGLAIKNLRDKLKNYITLLSLFCALIIK